MLNIWIGNLGKYNEGELVGDWLELPVSKTKLEKFLKENVKLDLTQEDVIKSLEKYGSCYEEYMINDYETDLPIEVGEYENIDMLNLIAIASEKVSDMNMVNAFLDSYGSLNDKYELINLFLQADDIPFYYFDDQKSFNSKEEKYGLQKAEWMGIQEILDKYDLSSYFDYEGYARDDETNGYVDIFEDGYIDSSELSNIDLNFYSEEEIKEMLGSELDDLDILEPKVDKLKNNENIKVDDTEEKLNSKKKSRDIESR